MLLFDEPKSKKQYIDMHMTDVLQLYKEKRTLHMIPGEGDTVVVGPFQQ